MDALHQPPHQYVTALSDWEEKFVPPKLGPSRTSIPPPSHFHQPARPSQTLAIHICQRPHISRPAIPAMALQNYRLINIDQLDPESSSNLDVSSLSPAVHPTSSADVQTLAGQVRQLLRGGDSEGALRGALENVPYGGDERAKVRRAWRARQLAVLSA